MMARIPGPSTARLGMAPASCVAQLPGISDLVASRASSLLPGAKALVGADLPISRIIRHVTLAL